MQFHRLHLPLRHRLRSSSGHQAAEGEVAAGVGDVEGDLSAQSFGVGELSFVAEAAEEGEAERCLLVEVDGVEVEEVGFDGEGIGAEGGAVADVGDGVEGFGGGAAADGEGGDVDAVGGEEFGVGGEVDGGDGVAGAVAAAMSGGTVDCKGLAEEGARVTDVALGDECADTARRDGAAAEGAGA